MKEDKNNTKQNVLSPYEISSKLCYERAKYEAGLLLNKRLFLKPYYQICDVLIRASVTYHQFGWSLTRAWKGF